MDEDCAGATLACTGCRRTPSVAEFLDGARDYRQYPFREDYVTVIHHECTCGEVSEVRVMPGRIYFGYLYAVCQAHYCPVKCAPVPGLTVVDGDAHVLLGYEGRTWAVPLAATPWAELPGRC
ncbi:MAG: hypothetical protein ABT940_08560 [Alphaproteobacteria bacterium]